MKFLFVILLFSCSNDPYHYFERGDNGFYKSIGEAQTKIEATLKAKKRAEKYCEKDDMRVSYHRFKALYKGLIDEQYVEIDDLAHDRIPYNDPHFKSSNGRYPSSLQWYRVAVDFNCY